MYYHYRGEDWDRLKRSASEERMEQVREFDGEQAYEKMIRAMERADQEKARQVERSSKLPALKRPDSRGPERSGPERDFGPAARSFPRALSSLAADLFLCSLCLESGVGVGYGSPTRFVVTPVDFDVAPAQERPLPSKGDDVPGQTSTRQKSRIRE